MKTAAETERAKYQRLGAVATLDLPARKHRAFEITMRPGNGYWTAGYYFPASIFFNGPHMEIYGALDHDEIEALRDKCNEILAACEEPASQPEAQDAA